MQLSMLWKRILVGLRLRIIWVLAAAVLGASVYFVVPALVPDRLVQTRIDEQIGRWTGGAFRLHSDAGVTVEPGFRVVMTDPAFVSVADAEAGPVVTADSIVAPLRILPLLFGRVEFVNFVLLRPDIDLRTPTRQFASDAGPQAQGETPTGQASPLGEVILIDGTVRFDGRAGVGEVSGLNLRLATDVSSDAVAIQGDLIVDARQLHVDLQLDDLGALVSAAGTQGNLNVRVDPRQESENGDVAASTQGMPYGITDRVRQLAGAIGLTRHGSMAAEGTFSVTPHTVDISDATFSLGGMEMEGHVRARTAGPQVIIQVLGLVDAVNATVAYAAEMGDGEWVDTPVTMTWFDGLDLDVEMSRDDLQFGNLTLDTVAVSFVVDDRTATLSLAGNRDGLGQVEAGVSLEYATNEQVRLAASGRVDDVLVGNITHFLASIGPPPLIGTAQMPEGMMNGAFDLRANGYTLGQMLDSLNGSITARLTDGSLAGADLVATLETLGRGREFMTEEHGPLIPAAGRTHFDQLDAQVDFASGTDNVSEVQIAGERFEVSMLGNVQLAEGRLNVGGHAVLLSLPGTSALAGDALVDLPFGVGGTVFAPVVAPGVPTVAAIQVGSYADY